MKVCKLFSDVRSAVLLSLLLGLVVSGLAQVEAGRFVGRITDAQGAGVIQATVKVMNVNQYWNE